MPAVARWVGYKSFTCNSRCISELRRQVEQHAVRADAADSDGDLPADAAQLGVGLLHVAQCEGSEQGRRQRAGRQRQHTAAEPAGRLQQPPAAAQPGQLRPRGGEWLQPRPAPGTSLCRAAARPDAGRTDHRGAAAAGGAAVAAGGAGSAPDGGRPADGPADREHAGAGTSSARPSAVSSAGDGFSSADGTGSVIADPRHEAGPSVDSAQPGPDPGAAGTERVGPAQRQRLL